MPEGNPLSSPHVCFTGLADLPFETPTLRPLGISFEPADSSSESKEACKPDEEERGRWKTLVLIAVAGAVVFTLAHLATAYSVYTKINTSYKSCGEQEAVLRVAEEVHRAVTLPQLALHRLYSDTNITGSSQDLCTMLSAVPGWDVVSTGRFEQTAQSEWSYAGLTCFPDSCQLSAMASQHSSLKVTETGCADKADYDYGFFTMQHIALLAAPQLSASWGSVQKNTDIPTLPMFARIGGVVSSIYFPTATLLRGADKLGYTVAVAVHKHGVVAVTDDSRRNDAFAAWSFLASEPSDKKQGVCGECKGVVHWRRVRVEEGLALVVFSLGSGVAGPETWEDLILTIGSNLAVSLLWSCSTVALAWHMQRRLKGIASSLTRVILMKQPDEIRPGKSIVELRDIECLLADLMEQFAFLNAFLPKSVRSRSEGMSVCSTSGRLAETPDCATPRRPVHASVLTLQTLQPRMVSMLYGNMRGSHRLVEKVGAEAYAATHSSVIALWKRYVEQYDGVVDGFCGDRVVASFNGSQVSLRHEYKACLAADSISRGAAEGGWHVTIGIASSDALVGVMGPDGLKQYTVLSRALPLAVLLERLCTVYRTTTLVHAAVVKGAPTILFKDIDVIHAPAVTSSPSGLITVSTIFSSDSAMPEEGEWMYLLQQIATTSPVSAYNAALKHARMGMWDEAQALAEEIRDDDQLTARLRAIIQSRGRPAEHFFANGSPAALGPLSP